MILVLDSSAILAMLRNERGGSEIAEAVDEPENTCYAHAANLCEVYYGLSREKGKVFAREKIEQLQEAGIIAREDMDTTFWQFAGDIKAELARISLADCYCVSLANKLGAEVLTTNRHELNAVVSRGICPIRFVR